MYQPSTHPPPGLNPLIDSWTLETVVLLSKCSQTTVLRYLCGLGVHQQNVNDIRAAFEKAEAVRDHIMKLSKGTK